MFGDLMCLQQVILNLFSNVIKFIDIGCIVLYVQCVGDYLQISVCDIGEGILVKEVLCFFDFFFQVGIGVQCNFQGIGFGLVICEKLISMMDGDIVVEIELGMGSCFIICIFLYGVQNILLVSRDGFVGKICWLVIYNILLVMFVILLFSYYGLMVCCYVGEMLDVEDVLFIDDEVLSGWQGRVMVIFCCCYIGILQEWFVGEWLYSVMIFYELLLLLGCIFYVVFVSVENSLVLMVLEVQVGNNDDMMIFVVDDYLINCCLLVDQLGLFGYQCVIVNDGIDVFNVFSKQYIDIVFSDVNMFNMDGYCLMQCICQFGLMLLVIGVMVNVLVEEKQCCLELGMDSCLFKLVIFDVLK